MLEQMKQLAKAAESARQTMAQLDQTATQKAAYINKFFGEVPLWKYRFSEVTTPNGQKSYQHKSRVCVLPQSYIDTQMIQNKEFEGIEKFLGVNRVPISLWEDYNTSGKYFNELSPRMFGEEDPIESFIWNTIVKKYPKGSEEAKASLKLLNGMNSYYLMNVLILDHNTPELVGNVQYWKVKRQKNKGKDLLAMEKYLFQDLPSAVEADGEPKDQWDILESFAKETPNGKACNLYEFLIGEEAIFMGKPIVRQKLQPTASEVKRSTEAGTLEDHIKKYGSTFEGKTVDEKMENIWKKTPSLLNLYNPKNRLSNDELLAKWLDHKGLDQDGNPINSSNSHNSNSLPFEPSQMFGTGLGLDDKDFDEIAKQFGAV